jgi:hypothetical protein
VGKQPRKSTAQPAVSKPMPLILLHFACLNDCCTGPPSGKRGTEDSRTARAGENLGKF